MAKGEKNLKQVGQEREDYKHWHLYFAMPFDLTLSGTFKLVVTLIEWTYVQFPKNEGNFFPT